MAVAAIVAAALAALVELVVEVLPAVAIDVLQVHGVKLGFDTVL